MSISLTTQQRADLRKYDLAIRALARFDLDAPTGTFGLWDGDGSVEYDGVTYDAAGSVADISPLPGTVGTGAEGIVITLDGARLGAAGVEDPAAVLASIQDEQIRNRRFTLYLALFDRDSGANLLTLERWGGLMDTAHHIVEPGRNVRLEIRIESFSLLMHQVHARTRSHADQLNLAAGDDFFKYTASASAGLATLYWGQKAPTTSGSVSSGGGGSSSYVNVAYR